MKFSFFILFLFFSHLSFAKGIIIADEQKQIQLFNTPDSTLIIKFADQLSSEYNKVILHLGKDFVFRKGNIYSTEISKRNLSVFCKRLNKQNVEIILWFFDSYGAESFIKIYKEHKQIIEENIAELTKMDIPFTGIAVDLEWINLHNFENNTRFIELMQNLKNRITQKKIYFFTSLIDSPDENIKRGYNIPALSKIPAYPITMLYVKDGGFKKNKIIVEPYLNDNRIKELVKYYKKKKWDIAFSMEGSILQGKNNQPEIIELSTYDSLQTIIKKTKKHSFKFYTITDYEIIKEQTFMLKNGTLKTFVKNDKLFDFSHTGKLPDKNCFIWEYFSIQSAISEKSK